jgi:hypothetical protein
MDKKYNISEKKKLIPYTPILGDRKTRLCNYLI